MGQINTDLDIINEALVSQGIRPGTSRSENTRPMQVMNARYEGARDEMLAKADWNCATKRVTLDLLDSTPEWGFDNEYQMPADFMRFHRMWNLDVPFRIEGDKFLCDNADIDIIYIYRLTEVAAMHEHFKHVIATYLAWKTCLANKADAQQAAQLKADHFENLADAFLIEARQAPVDQMQSSLWLQSHWRFPTGGYRPIEDAVAP